MNEIATRIGISPFSAKQHIGVYRSFLVSVFVANYYKGKTFLRIDDTNPCHQANVNALIDDLTRIINPAAFAPLPSNEDGVVRVGSKGIPAISESQRVNLYHRYLKRLRQQNLLIEKDGAIFFDTEKYVSLYGDQIELPYQGKPRRTGSVIKSLAKPCFPIAVNEGKRFLWHFTSVIDDKSLGITHVVRGKDKIDNQIPQTMLIRALKFLPPQYLYTKILLSDQPLPLVDDLIAAGISLEAIRSYLYGTITGKPEKNYLSFEEALTDFSPKTVIPGQMSFDYHKLVSIQRHLSGHQESLF